MSAEPGPVEKADGERSGPFPASWGVPEGGAHSERRAAWIARHARREELHRKMSPPWSAYRRAEAERRAQR